MTDLATPTPTAEDLRARLVERLLADGAITTAAVEAAVRAVAREAFAPAGTDLVDAYADEAVITKRRPDGQALSSVSAPWLSLSTPVVLRSGRHRLDTPLTYSMGERLPDRLGRLRGSAVSTRSIR